MKFIFSLVLLLSVFNNASAQEAERLWPDKNEDGKVGLMTSEKKIIVAHQYDAITRKTCDYSSHLIYITQIGDKYGIIDKWGNEIITPKYDAIELHSQSGDWIITKLDGKLGFAMFAWWNKEKGAPDVFESFPPLYDKIYWGGSEGSPSGFVTVTLGDKKGLVNERSGKEITGMKYDYVSDFFFYQGHLWAEVGINGKHGLIDQNGTLVIPCEYDDINYIEGDGDLNDKIRVTKGDKEYFINRKNQMVK